MALRRIDKPVVVHFLESSKEVLSHISAWTVELNTRGQEAGKTLNQIYGTTRRLRDYLQRSLTAYPQPVKLDLSEADENVLVSCFLHSIANLDAALAKNIRSLSDRALLEQKRSVLGDWALEFASRLPERIPVANKLEANTSSTRGVLASITEKLTGRSAPEKPGDVPPARATPSGGEQDPALQGQKPGDPPRREIEKRPPLAPKRATGETAESAPALALEPAWPQPFERTSLYPEIQPEPIGLPEQQETEEILDAKRLRDPRLRSMVALDQRSFERALAAADYRLALVHLYSIFEAGVVDHGLARRAELGLQDNIESWLLEGILAKALGDRFSAADRSLMGQLVSARSLIRPAIQVMSPLVVTHASLNDARALVKRLFVELGLAGSGGKVANGDAMAAPGLVAGRGDGSGWARP